MAESPHSKPTVRLDEVEATLKDEITPGCYVMIVVSDTRAGISAGALERVFDPFFTTKQVGNGSGLGLSMITASSDNPMGMLRSKVTKVRGRGSRCISPKRWSLPRSSRIR